MFVCVCVCVCVCVLNIFLPLSLYVCSSTLQVVVSTWHAVHQVQSEDCSLITKEKVPADETPKIQQQHDHSHSSDGLP